MSKIKNPKYIFIAYITASDKEELMEVVLASLPIFAAKGTSVTFKNFLNNLTVLSVTSESPIKTELVNLFEARVGSNKYAEILFSYLSEKAVYLYSLILFYDFEEKQADHSRNFRRELTYAAYDLITAEVAYFQQSTNSTSLVLCSNVRIPDEEIAAVLVKTNIKQVTTTISFKSF